MYFVLYDRHLRSIGETYKLESWSKIKRATDFDDMRIVGEAIPYSANPFIVVANDRQGRIMHSGLASTPAVDDKTKKTTITLKDYMTLFNSEIIINWNEFKGKNLAEYISFILTCWNAQIDIGLKGIEWVVTDVQKVLLDKNISTFNGIESVTVYDLISDAINYYELYCEPELNIAKKKLIYKFKRASINPVSIRLRDFGVNVIEKSFGDYNRATVYTSSYEKYQTWALTEENSIVILPNETALVYPAKNRNFIAEEESEDLTESQALNNAVYDAVMGLAGNRFQENIDLDAAQYKSVLDLTNIDFSYKVQVYTDEGFYRALPVGEIETDSKGTNIIRLGYRIQELTQEI